MTRVFLDANVLFSAAYRETNGILRLWEYSNVQLVTSRYALVEAERNIAAKRPQATERFARLTASLELTEAQRPLADDFKLPEKDRPIIEAAVSSDCTVLITGDVTHFSPLIGQTVSGITVLTVSMFIAVAESLP